MSKEILLQVILLYYIHDLLEIIVFHLIQSQELHLIIPQLDQLQVFQ